MAVITAAMLYSDCRKPLGEGQLVTTRWYTSNRRDPLFGCTDSVVHAACAQQADLDQALAEMERQMRARGLPIRCAACGEKLRFPDIHRPVFALGRVSSGRAGPLVEFDHLFFHADHLETWPRWAELKQRIEEARLRGEWEGPLPNLQPYAHWPGHAVIDPTKIRSIDDPD